MKTCTCILELSVNYRVFGLGVYQKILFFPMKIINMRYHLFLHHRWFAQNFGKDFIPTNMHMTVPCSPDPKINSETMKSELS